MRTGELFITTWSCVAQLHFRDEDGDAVFSNIEKGTAVMYLCTHESRHWFMTLSKDMSMFHVSDNWLKTHNNYVIAA
jgi:hypothetical protein